MKKYLENIWYSIIQPNIFIFSFLKLFTYLYSFFFFLRKKLSKPYKSKIPIIVVGNLTVGGTGKTPFVIYLIDLLKSHGYKVAVISRGFGGNYKEPFREVFKTSDYLEVGDEPLLIKRKSKIPIFVAKDRRFAIEYIESFCDIDFIISDDGLQNFGFSYEISFVVVDGQRKFGNNNILPLGPLREPLANIIQYDFVLFNVLKKIPHFVMIMLFK